MVSKLAITDLYKLIAREKTGNTEGKQITIVC